MATSGEYVFSNSIRRLALICKALTHPARIEILKRCIKKVEQLSMD